MMLPCPWRILERAGLYPEVWVWVLAWPKLIKCVLLALGSLGSFIPLQQLAMWGGYRRKIWGEPPVLWSQPEQTGSCVYTRRIGQVFTTIISKGVRIPASETMCPSYVTWPISIWDLDILIGRDRLKALVTSSRCSPFIFLSKIPSSRCAKHQRGIMPHWTVCINRWDVASPFLVQRHRLKLMQLVENVKGGLLWIDFCFHLAIVWTIRSSLTILAG